PILFSYLEATALTNKHLVYVFNDLLIEINFIALIICCITGNVKYGKCLDRIIGAGVLNFSMNY
ncbi:MAG TPA: hypothetical protein VNR38_20260, partial [Ureibacillus sp.]|nr:hypothetical protein [Ureibacillus sp.]